MAYNQNYSNRDEIRFDLKERLGVLAIKDNGWTKEVNIVAWNGGKAKVDIREWDPSHKRMTKGITLFEEEAELLTKALAGRYGIGHSGASSAGTMQAAPLPEDTAGELYEDGQSAPADTAAMA